MRNFRISVGISLKGKIDEHGFFLDKIIETTKIIEDKSLRKEFPIDSKTKELSYFYSAYLNTIQSLKDSFQTVADTTISWSELSPSYGNFIFYCRNAVTHDGSHLINAFSGNRHYITKPLRRIDGKGKVIEFDPPEEDIFTLCCNITDEILTNLEKVLTDYRHNIQFPEETDFKKSIQIALESNFIPENFKSMIKGNQTEIESSFKDVKIDTVKETMDAIVSVKKMLANVQT